MLFEIMTNTSNTLASFQYPQSYYNMTQPMYFPKGGYFAFDEKIALAEGDDEFQNFIWMLAYKENYGTWHQ